jgi:hypothetical protein
LEPTRQHPQFTPFGESLIASLMRGQEALMASGNSLFGNIGNLPTNPL